MYLDVYYFKYKLLLYSFNAFLQRLIYFDHKLYTKGCECCIFS